MYCDLSKSDIQITSYSSVIGLERNSLKCYVFGWKKNQRLIQSAKIGNNIDENVTW